MFKQRIMLTHMATENYAQFGVVAIGCTPGLHVFGNAQAHAARAVIHCAFFVRWIEKQAGQAVARRYAVFAYALPVATGDTHITQALLKGLHPLTDKSGARVFVALPGVAQVRELAVDAPPGVAQVRELAVDALPG